MSKQICIPVIDPPSGTYCPPLNVICYGTVGYQEELWVVIVNSKSKVRRQYTGPFIIDDRGRVQLSAFVRRPGQGDGPETTTIYELDVSAPPQGRPSADHQRGGIVSPTRSLIQVPSQNKTAHVARRLNYESLPGAIHSLKPFDIVLNLCDTSGEPVTTDFKHDDKNKSLTAVITLDVPVREAVLTCKANIFLSCEAPERKVPNFYRLRDILVVREDNNSYSIGMTSGNTIAQEGIGISSPVIGVLGGTCEGCGVEFKVASHCKAMVGLDSDIKETETGRSNVAYGFHFSFEMPSNYLASNQVATSDSTGCYKVYDKKDFSTSGNTFSYRLGDRFGLRVRESGEVDYIHNDAVVYTSRSKQHLDALYSCIIKILDQASFPCLSDFALIPKRKKQQIIVKQLLYNGPSCEGKMRAWIFGEDCDVAIARVRLYSSSVPKWALSTFSVASMFLVGAVGCDGSQIVESMLTIQSDSLQLFQVKNEAALSSTAIAGDSERGYSIKDRDTNFGTESSMYRERGESVISSIDSVRRRTLDAIFDMPPGRE